MCERCAAEYEDPADRRFHAQPNACPRVRPAGAADRRATGVELDPGDGLDAVCARRARCSRARSSRSRDSAAIHLACRADDEPAVARLRARKHREERPFALMAADLDAARALVVLGDARRGAAVLARRARSCSPRGAATAPASRPRSHPAAATSA